MRHQFIMRDTGIVLDEKIFHDSLVNFFYSAMREDSSLVYRLVTSRWASSVMAWVNYDFPAGGLLGGGRSFLKEAGIDTSEFYDEPSSLDTARKFFERRIRYEEFRPLPDGENIVVSPADARMLPGTFREDGSLFLKEKFFSLQDLLGERNDWVSLFIDGDYAVFRLTPEKYHYSHSPVSGVVKDFYEIDGAYNSCNPGAVIAVNGAYSKNRRAVTIIDTDVYGGTRCGTVAMIEVAALMIGDIVQCYSEKGYDSPVYPGPGLFLKKGKPKSLFRPGSSVDILIFEKGRICFDEDIVRNATMCGIETRYLKHFSKPVVETDVRVRSSIGTGIQNREVQ